MPALDGLRGLALAAVVAFHLWPGAVPGGFLGVDVFFVLSGFLITSILLRGFHAPGDHGGLRGYLGGFYARRARRLLPALLVWLILITVASRGLLASWQLGTVRDEALGAVAYVSNWQSALRDVAYFDTVATPSPFAHMWSLAIEEQMYLLWPVVLLAFVRVTGGRRVWLGVLISLLAVASAAAMVLTSDRDVAYFGTHTRAQALLLGALLSVWLATHARAEPSTRRFDPAPAMAAVGAISLAGLAAMSLLVDGTADWMYRGGFTLAAVLAVGAVAAAARGVGMIGLLLAWSPLRTLGRVSYGCYLIHWPVIVFLDEQRIAQPWLLDTTRLVVIAVLTAGSYLLVEQPVRLGRLRFSQERVGALSAAGGVVVLALVVGQAATPLPFYLRSTEPAGDASPPPQVFRPPKPEPGQTVPFPPDGLRQITLVGDSVAASLAPGLAEAANDRGITVVSRAKVGCGALTNSVAALEEGGPVPFTRACPFGVTDAQRAAAADGSDLVLVLTTWEGGPRWARGRTLRPGSAEWQTSVEAGLDDLAARLAAQGSEVGFLLEPPRTFGARTVRAVDAERARAWASLQQRWARAHGHLVVDLAPQVCGDRIDDCPTALRGVELRPEDGRHFDPANTSLVAPAILREIERAWTP